MPKTVESISGYAVKDGSTVEKIFETEEQADAYAATVNSRAALTAARAAIATYNEDATENIITINYSLTESGSLADLNTTLEGIKTDYGISAPS